MHREISARDLLYFMLMSCVFFCRKREQFVTDVYSLMTDEKTTALIMYDGGGI